MNVDDLGNVGAGGPGTAVGPIVVNVAAMSASPVLSGAKNLLPTREDAAIDTGTQVSSLLSGHVTDADAGALTGMAVIAVRRHERDLAILRGRRHQLEWIRCAERRFGAPARRG